MDSRIGPLPPFYRDAIVATAAFALLLAPVAGDGPGFLSGPGFVLALPLLGVYILAGGETESPFGPTAVHFAVYAIALGVLTAIGARAIRRRFDVSGLATLRFLASAVLAVGGTIVLLLGLLGVVDLFTLDAIGPVATLAIGIIVLAAGLALAWTAD